MFTRLSPTIEHRLVMDDEFDAGERAYDEAAAAALANSLQFQR